MAVAAEMVLSGSPILSSSSSNRPFCCSSVVESNWVEMERSGLVTAMLSTV